MKLLSLILAFTLMFSCCAVAAADGENGIEMLLSRMTLREKAAQMMLPAFRTWKEGDADPVNVTELNGEIREMLAREHFGGVLLFGENFVDAGQTLRLVADMQMANQSGGGVPMLIAVDEEGGNVARLNYGVIGVSNMALGATGDPENARIMAGIHGEEIGLLGINVNFAPVMDVNSNAANPVIGIRSFSDGAATVAEYGKAYIQGLHEAGIIATVKHFPGHGNTDTDSHTGFPVINSTYEELLANELIPFKAGIEAGADMVMTAHIQFPQIETETYTSVSTGEKVYLPATMSRTILTDILRGDLGFEGVIVSDDLEMAAVAQNFTTEDTLRLAINAGVDLLILPSVFDMDTFHEIEAALDMAVRLVESGEIDESLINESVRRILTLKQKYGLLEQTDCGAVTEEQIAAAQAGIGSQAHKDTEWQIAEKALTLVKNEKGAFPLNLQAGEKTLILFVDSCASRVGAGDLAAKLLEEKQALPEGAEIVTMKNTADNEGACIEAAKNADHVILVHRVYSIACLNPATGDGFSSGAFDKIIEAVHEMGKTVIVVSCQLPYDAARFPEADAILLTYWSSIMWELPKEGSSWSVNLPVGLLSCFGLYSAEGKLPVNIPALDDSYLPTDKVLFSRYQ